MTLPPCPIAGHDNPHHFHRANGTPCDPTGVHGDCGTSIGPFSRCYSAHVPEPTPDPDEWARVDVDTMIPEGVTFRKASTKTWRVHLGHGPVYVRRSDLDKLAPPDPAAKLAAALTKAGDGTWNAADVRAALKSAGLTLGAEK